MDRTELTCHEKDTFQDHKAGPYLLYTLVFSQECVARVNCGI